MIRITSNTVRVWTAAGRRFVAARPSAATHYVRDSKKYIQEVTRSRPDLGLRYAEHGYMRTARACTPVEQKEEQLAAVARVARRDSRA